MTDLHKVVADEAMLWGDAVAEPYHALAASHMDSQWAGLIAPALDGIDVDLTRSADFACGRGRNTLKLLDEGAKHVTMIDVNAENVAFCTRQFAGNDRITVTQNDGLDLRVIPSSAFTYLHSFDAMVHFDVEIALGYLREFHRVMRAGAVALIHHSNYSERPGVDFRTNPHFRNYMTADLFRHVATRRGFEVLRQRIFSWADLVDGDCITVLRKPAGEPAKVSGMIDMFHGAIRRSMRGM